MNGWTDELMDGWMDGWTDGWMDGWMDEETERRVGGRTDKCVFSE